MIGERWNDKYVERDSRGLVEIISPHLPEVIEE
jgi:hypothetical protein